MAKKKGFLKGLLFEDEPEKPTTVPVEEKQEAAVPAKPTPVATTKAASAAGEVDVDIQNQLVQVLEDNNVEGYDYFEFKGSLKNMQNVIKNEPERFKAAFAAVASMVSPEKLVETANFYIGKLNDKKEEFGQFVNSMMDEKVVSKEKEATAIDEAVAKKQEQITQLNQEISEAQDKKSTLINEAISEKAKIEKVQANFNLTHVNVISMIEQDIQKIQTYLIPKAEAKPEEATAK